MQSMTSLEEILEKSLLTQLGLEEQLYKNIESQLSQEHIEEFADVKEMLKSVKAVLEKHFVRINAALDSVANQIKKSGDGMADDGSVIEFDSRDRNQNRIQRDRVSQMLRDDYAALNLAAMGNSVLHTTALAADSEDLAKIVIEHLTTLTTFVARMTELVPRVAALELSAQFPEVKPSILELAVTNARRAWRVAEDLTNTKNLKDS